LNRPPSARVVFYTDVHARPGRAISQSLEAAAVAIGAQRADVVIAGGDMVGAGTGVAMPEAQSMWLTYGSMLATIGGHVHHVFGEHDLVGPAQAVRRGADPRSLVRERLGRGRTYGSFDAADFHFVLLDSVEVARDGAGYRGFIDRQQLDWLTGDISRIPTTKPVIVTTHVPLRTAAYAPGGAPPDRAIVNAQDVLDVLMRRSLVLVLQGLSHKSEAIQHAGVTYLSGGAICGHWSPHDGAGAPGFVVASVTPERVEWKYVAYEAV
jgi:3',5'-cyclic AMP phosphodiesterase CpdA